MATAQTTGKTQLPDEWCATSNQSAVTALAVCERIESVYHFLRG